MAEKIINFITLSLKADRWELLYVLKRHPESPMALKLDIEGAEY